MYTQLQNNLNKRVSAAPDLLPPVRAKKRCGGGITTFHFNQIWGVPGEGPAHAFPVLVCSMKLQP